MKHWVVTQGIKRNPKRMYKLARPTTLAIKRSELRIRRSARYVYVNVIRATSAFAENRQPNDTRQVEFVESRKTK